MSYKKAAQILPDELIRQIQQYVDGVTDESWESFQTELANAGADRYIEIYQRVFDDYMAQQ